MTHGHTRREGSRVIVSAEYRAWRNMKYRCLNKDSPQYADYGGRGIRVAPRWMSFAEFFADMGPKPSSRHTLERRHNNEHYEKRNCYWATPAEQAANRRKAMPGRNPRPERQMTNPNLGQPVKNKHKVPVKQWNKWSNLARRVYNDMMYSLRPSMQFAFLHPDAKAAALEHWQTTRHNVAWTAAEAIKSFRLAGATTTRTRWTKARKAKKKAVRRGK